MKTFLAVDFGTTQTSITLLKEKSESEPEVIDINDGQKVVKAIATAMQLDDNKNITYFGAKALAKAEEDPENTFQNFKVFIGKKDRAYQLKTEQNKYSPDELALLFLRHLREEIERQYFNGIILSKVSELTCVFGCPSDWNEVQKNTLKSIAVEAGFPNPMLCDEPIGVIYYNHFFGGLKLKKLQNILVYDFGGGTTDVAIAKVVVSENGKIEPSILSTSGLTDLGGRDFDEAIYKYYLNENNYDLRKLSVKERLHDQWVINRAAREAKEDLSSKSPVEKIINRLKVINSQRPNKLLLSREKFNEICAPLISQFGEPIYNALTEAGLSDNDIDFVILAGGSSAMLYVLNNIKKIFSPVKTKILISSDVEIIAKGLAIYGRSQALGLKAKEGLFDASADKATTKKKVDLDGYFNENNRENPTENKAEKDLKKLNSQEIKLPKWFEPLWGILYGLAIVNAVCAYPNYVGFDSFDKIIMFALLILRGIGVTCWLYKHRQSVFLRNLTFIACIADMVVALIVFPLDIFFQVEFGSIIFLMWILFWKSNVGVILGVLSGLILIPEIANGFTPIPVFVDGLLRFFVREVAITKLFLMLCFFYDSFITWKNLKKKTLRN